jgi:hypothetical protein
MIERRAGGIFALEQVEIIFLHDDVEFVRTRAEVAASLRQPFAGRIRSIFAAGCHFSRCDFGYGCGNLKGGFD